MMNATLFNFKYDQQYQKHKHDFYHIVGEF